MRLSKKQTGAALLLILLLLGTAAATLLVHSLKSRDLDQIKRQRSAQALLAARAALIAWSLSSANSASHIPGQLPCPDTNAVGSANEGNAAGSCTAGAIGHFPWKTLGIERLVDGWGEPLWYSVDGMYRAPTGMRLLNSDVRATLQVYRADGVSLQTPAGEEAAAVLFAPGAVLAGQNRSITTNAANYLEAVAGRQNYTAGGPYIAGDVTATFNDQVLAISGREWIARLAPRLAAEIKLTLNAYRVANGHYPAPALLSDTRCSDNALSTGLPNDGCRSDPSLCRGILPQLDETGVAINYPVWFRGNLWHRAIYYSLGNAASCGTLTLRETGKADTHPAALFVLPGTPLGNITRIAAVQTSSSMVTTNLIHYLEDAENQDGWSVGANDLYIQPSASSNDQLYVLP